MVLLTIICVNYSLALWFVAHNSWKVWYKPMKNMWIFSYDFYYALILPLLGHVLFLLDERKSKFTFRSSIHFKTQLRTCRQRGRGPIFRNMVLILPAIIFYFCFILSVFGHKLNSSSLSIKLDSNEMISAPY